MSRSRDLLRGVLVGEVDRGDGDPSFAAPKFLCQPSELRLRPRDEQQVHAAGGQLPGDVLADAA